MGVRFVHWSREPKLELQDDYPYDPEFFRPFKPRGLWVTDESDISWEKWCAENDFGCGQHRIDLAVTDQANLLWLKTEQDILNFTDQYGKGLSDKMPDYKLAIRWEEIVSQYHGIMIFPYQWGLRLDDRVPWYYPWDCASGCVWKPKTALQVVDKEKRGR